MSHRLVKARINAGLSIGQTAKLLGMDREKLEAIEAATEGPDELTSRRLAELYHVNAPWMLGEVPERVSEEKTKASIVCALQRGKKKQISQKDLDTLAEFIASMPGRRFPKNGNQS